MNDQKHIELEASIFKVDGSTCTIEDVDKVTDAIIEAIEKLGMQMASLQYLKSDDE